MAGAQLRTSCRSLFKQIGILPVPCQCILSLINFIISNKELFRQFHLHTLLVRVISTIFTDQMPPILFLKKVKCYAGIRIFASLPRSSTILKNEKTIFKVAIRKYLHTSFTVYEFFVSRLSPVLFLKWFR